MIKINILPPHLKNKIHVLVYVREFYAYIVLVFMFFALVNAGLVFVITQKELESQILNSQWKSKEQQFNEFITLKNDTQTLRDEVANFSGYIQGKFQVSEVLYIIYEKLPANAWFKEVRFSGGILTLKGAALDVEKDASLTIKDYQTALKASKLAGYFSGGIDISAMDRYRVKDKNILRFEIVLKKPV